MKIEFTDRTVKYNIVADVPVGVVFTASGLASAGANPLYLMTYQGLVDLCCPNHTWERNNRSRIYNVVVYPNAKVVTGAPQQ